MTLKIRTTGAADYGHFVKMLIAAPSGSGKTVFGATSIQPLFVDCEGGLMSIADKDVPYAPVETTTDIKQLITILGQDEATQKEMLDFNPGTIVVDTVDEVQRMFERERLQETGRETLSMQDFGWLKDRMLDMIREFRNLDKNIIFLCHTKDVSDEESGATFVKPGLKGAVADEIAAYMDIVGTIGVEEFTDVQGNETVRKVRHVMNVQPDRRHDWLKDRSAKLPTKIVLDGDKDFKRIYKTVFSNPQPATDTSEKVVDTPVEETPDVIEKTPEQQPDPNIDKETAE